MKGWQSAWVKRRALALDGNPKGWQISLPLKREAAAMSWWPRCFLLAVVLLLLPSLPTLAAEVEYCGQPGIAKASLKQFDGDVFVDCYDAERRMPFWGAYRLQRENVETAGTRKQAFRTDPRLMPAQTATCADYKKHRDLLTGGDPKKNFMARGHTVPDADMRYAPEAQAYSYFLSNMSPQWQLFNGGIWSSLEVRVRDWAKTSETIYVITGPIFDKENDSKPDPASQAERMKPTKRVGVATHFFKIVLRKDSSGEWEALAFLLPHWKSGRPPGPKKKPEDILRGSLVSIRAIQERVGFDLLPGVTGDTKMRLEETVPADLWPRN
jgi:endonuclease G